ncbi:MAG: VPLPA-CTERM sorting domain-containing protein [Phycisphaerae bacterium]|nr:VPLPA-CTERM sorting domain-containing protein [Phycisphaerae bacterium]
MKRRVIILTIVGTLYALATVHGAAIRSGFDSFALAQNDPWSPLTPLGFNLNFFGVTYSSLYVNTDGCVTFDAPFTIIFAPFALTTTTGTPIITPFFADVDTRDGGSGVVRYGSGAVDGHTAFGVSWIDVGYFLRHDDKLDSFQLVLIDRSDRHPGDADLEFNYDTVLWESGDWSGGVLGLGGLSARAGYSNGTGDPGTYDELPGSGVPGCFLDGSSTGLIHGSLNSPVAGRYVLSICNDQAPTIPAPGALLLTLIGAAFVGQRRRSIAR